MQPPPKGAGPNSYLTAVTRIEDTLIEIIDVEKILAEVAPTRDTVAAEFIDEDVK